MPHPLRTQARFLATLRPGAGPGALFDHLDLPVWIKDRAGRFVVCNPAFLTLLGVRSERDVLGLRDADFFPRHLCDAYARDDQTVIRTGKPIIDRIEPLQNADGSLGWRRTSKVPVSSRRGAVAGVAGVTRWVKPVEGSGKPVRGLDAVLDIIISRYAERLEVAELARQAGLSVSQFERRFRQRFAVTPWRYLTQVRIAAARHKLAHSADPIVEVAMAVGFCDQSHFTHQFTREIGVPPGRFRRAFQTRA